MRLQATIVGVSCVFVGLLTGGEGNAGQDHCDCEVSQSKRNSFNALLMLDDDEKAESSVTHLPWGVPTEPSGATNEHLMFQRHYVINHDDDLRVPIWVAYRLRKSDVEVHRERTECFRKDPRLGDDEAAFCEDFEEPIFGCDD